MSDNKELTTINNQVSVQEFTIDEIIKRKEKILEIQNKIMKKDIHYGTIPGTDKNTLYKAGAEIIQTTFMLACVSDKDDITIKDLPNGHREVIIRSRCIHYPTGMLLSVGIGSCSTMEKKYRYTSAGDYEDTGKVVPGEYWEAKKANNFDEMSKITGGKEFTIKKVDNVWKIVKKSNKKVENPDIADYYNTVFKMAMKRADICAIIKATACSDKYTQDLEDMAEEDLQNVTGNQNGKTTQSQQAGQAKNNNQPPKNSKQNDNGIFAKVNKIKDDALKMKIVREINQAKTQADSKTILETIEKNIDDVLSKQDTIVSDAEEQELDVF